MRIEADDGFFFGLGAFETVLLREGNPELLSMHLERLENSLSFLGIDRRVDAETVRIWLKEHRAEIPALSALKIVVTEKNASLLLRSNPYTQERIRKGFRLGISRVRRNETSPLVYHKTLNYGDNILEKRGCGKRDLDEVLFVNSRGEICEGSTTNVFFVKGGKICTPPVSCGLLPGVMRRFLLENLPVEERGIFKEEAFEAEEIFLTNSLMEVMPVTVFEGRELLSRETTFAVREKIRKRMEQR